MPLSFFEIYAISHLYNQVFVRRLLLITDFFCPEPGGLENFFSCLARQWQASQIEVIVTTRKKNYLFSEKERQLYKAKQDFKIHRAYPNSMFSYIFQKNDPLRSLFTKCLDHFHPDYILFSTLSLLNYILSREALSRNIPYALVLHAGALHRDLSSFHFFNRRLVQGSNTIFSLSWYIARSAIQSGVPAEKISVLPPAFEPRWESKNSFKLPKWLAARIARKTILLSVGPLVARKGLEKAIEAMAILRERHSQIHYVIAGSGPELAYLKEHTAVLRLKEHVSFTGLIDDDFLGALLKRSYIFLQPGAKRDDDSESLGMVFMEAAWFALPVVATKLGGVEEIVIDQVTGLLCDPDDANDIQSLASSVHNLLSSPKLYAKYSENAMKFAIRHFINQKLSASIQKRFSPSIDEKEIEL